jgi:hypothetical protein
MFTFMPSSIEIIHRLILRAAFCDDIKKLHT